MATSTEVAIATTTLGSAASTITFSSIPSTYTDLRLVLTGAVAGNDVYFRFNGDTATNYSATYLGGNGTSAYSGSQTNFASSYAGSLNTSTPSMITLDTFSYAGSTYKTTLTTGSQDNNGSGGTIRIAALWRSTSAITSLSLIGGTGASNNFTVGTTATLYGIL